MNFDLSTLLLGQAILMFVTNIIVLIFAASRPDDSLPLRTWGYGGILIALGLLQIAFQPILPGLIAKVLANILLGLGFYLLVDGAARLRQKSLKKEIQYTLLILYALSMIYFTYVMDSTATRIIIYSALTLYYSLHAAWLLMNTSGRALHVDELLMGLPLLASAILLFLRILTTLFTGSDMDNLVSEGSDQSIYLILYYILYLLIWVGILMMIAGRNARDLKNIRVEKDAALASNQSLLEEVQSRVKTNLGTIQYLLSIQEELSGHAVSSSKALEGSNRVRAVGHLRDKVLNTYDYAHLHIAGLLREIILDITESNRDKSQVNPIINIEDIQLDINTLIPLVLILNELVTNACVHAFDRGQKGVLEIRLSSLSSQRFQLIVKDDGCGLPEDFNLAGNVSVGLRIARSLVDQLNGKIEFDSEPGQGTVFQLKFENFAI